MKSQLGSRFTGFTIGLAVIVALPTGGKVLAAESDPARIVNIATRAQIGGNAGTPIAGFVLGGNGTKKMLVRACGPALTGFGVAGALADPSLALMAGTATMASNDNWLAADAATMATAGAFALTTGSKDAALVTTLATGAYTVPVTPLGGGNGVALLEVYDASSSASSALVNASTRAFVGTGDNVLIPGFVISGTGSLPLLIRAVGPGLTSFGVTGALADPTLTLYRGSTALATNDNWSSAANASGIAAAATAVGAFSLTAGSKDAAILTSLPAGSYTAVVSGVGNTTGTALVELYTVGTSVPVDTTTTFTPKYVRIPGGSYVMGDHFNYIDPGHPSDEIPLHPVTISPFYMSTTLLTCREYCDYLNAALAQKLIEVRAGFVYATGGTSILSDTTTAYPHSTITYANNTFTVRAGRDLHPITGMRWQGAITYCNWLSARDGYNACYNLATGACDMTKNGYRLPTEAEWEYAGRGGQTNPYRKFPWGDDTNIDGTYANWDGSGDPWEAAEYPRTTPVGFFNGALRSKADYNWPAAAATYQTKDGSNGYGLYDMSGNVWQWINDWYQTDYYQYCITNNIVTDPPGPAAGSKMPDGLTCRGLRGGNWYNGGGQVYFGHARVANRDPSYFRGPDPVTGRDDPDGPYFHIGFRVMRPEKTTATANTVGLMQNSSAAFEGYTLMAPMHSTTTYLINNAGQYVRKWTSKYEPGRSAYLLENGNMIRACMIMTGGPSTGGGEGGRIEEYDWAGNLVWSFDYVSPTYIHHHDFKVLPNGNVLLLAAEKKVSADVLAAGFNPALLDATITGTNGYMLPDYLVEVKPTKPSGGTVVWEWHIWDHMIQNFSATAKNYGVIADHPELINVNGSGIKIPQFWNHVNGVDYNAALDQVMISVRGNNELFVIDHSTTTAQAASHAGGKSGKGGDILYRWGDPQQYGRGTNVNRILYQQHHTHWIEPGLPGAGNILIYNNGIGRGYSTIEEVVPPVDAAGNYSIATGAAFGPTAPVWRYQATPPTAFYSTEISGCQRLPNGNTLVCEGVKGNLFEVNSSGTMVWRYVCPVTSAPLAQGSAVPVDAARPDQFMNAVFRVYRYAPTFPGLLGKDLTAIGPIETY